MARAVFTGVLLASWPVWAATAHHDTKPEHHAAKPAQHETKPVHHAPIAKAKSSKAIKPAKTGTPAPATPHTPAHVSPTAPAKPATPPAAQDEAPEDPHKGKVTGLPLPRFVALKTDEVDMRVGPGTRYPVQWVYKRRNLPVEIIREFDVWRLVQDADGVKGWMHQGTLTGHHTVLVTGGERVLRSTASEDAAPVARLQPGVIGRLRACEATASWCQVQVGDYHGWLRRNQFWGIEPGEAVQ